jgi:glutathione S-transferase
MAPHIALHEIGCASKVCRFRSAGRKAEPPAYLALNPEGKVPTLLVDGRPLTEVAAILFYLARRFPEADLLANGDFEAEAQTVSWMSFIAATVHAAKRKGIDQTPAVFCVADVRLGKREWAVGRFSIADIHLFRLYWRFRNSLHPPASHFPNLSAHDERMMTRPSVQRTIAVEAAIGQELKP